MSKKRRKLPANGETIPLKPVRKRKKNRISGNLLAVLALLPATIALVVFACSKVNSVKPESALPERAGASPQTEETGSDETIVINVETAAKGAEKSGGAEEQSSSSRNPADAAVDSKIRFDEQEPDRTPARVAARQKSPEKQAAFTIDVEAQALAAARPPQANAEANSSNTSITATSTPQAKKNRAAPKSPEWREAKRYAQRRLQVEASGADRFFVFSVTQTYPARGGKQRDVGFHIMEGIEETSDALATYLTEYSDRSKRFSKLAQAPDRTWTLFEAEPTLAEAEESLRKRMRIYASAVAESRRRRARIAMRSARVTRGGAGFTSLC